MKSTERSYLFKYKICLIAALHATILLVLKRLKFNFGHCVVWPDMDLHLMLLKANTPSFDKTKETNPAALYQ